jgi:hypothetical protein
MEVDIFPRDPSVVAPDGTRRPLDGESLPVVDGLWSLPEIDNLNRTGIWRVEWEGRSQPFTVELDPEEGNLQRIATGELESAHRTWRMAGVEDAGDDSTEDTNRGELWRLIAALALAMLVGETLWSAWLGRKRRLA